MKNDQQKAQLEWRDDKTPVSVQFDDPYFSLDSGLEETSHVFLAGNGLPARFEDGFHVAELGFGTGLNMLATLQIWIDSGQKGTLHFTSFEAYPMTAADIARSLEAFPTVSEFTQRFVALWDAGQRQFDLGSMKVEVVGGDARATIADWRGKSDAWYLDGFSPTKNPELWEPALMQEVAAHTNAGGTFATYTAAGHIRRSLADVGFEVERVRGFGRKRHMTIGHLK